MTVRLDTHELAWAAGFFDGEGHCAALAKKNVHMGVCQAKDMYVLERFQAAVGGLGSISIATKVPEGHLPRGVWSIQKFESIMAVTAMLWNWLSPVSRKKIAAALSNVRARGGYQKRPGWCPKGHQLTPENTYIKPSSGRRSCRICRHDKNKEWAKDNRALLNERQKLRYRHKASLARAMHSGGWSYASLEMD